MKYLPLALLLLATPAVAQQARPLTVTLTAREAAFINGALSHEIQLACMFGQCAAVNPAALSIPRKLARAEAAAQKAAQKAKAGSP